MRGVAPAQVQRVASSAAREQAGRWVHSCPAGIQTREVVVGSQMIGAVVALVEDIVGRQTVVVAVEGSQIVAAVAAVAAVAPVG